MRDETALLVLVHDALRRDTARLGAAVEHDDLARPDRVEPLRRGWQRLHRELLRHHREQDLLLLPTARIYLPARHEEIAVLDVVENGHRRLETMATAVDTALLGGDAVWFAEAVATFRVEITGLLGFVESAAVPLLETTLGARDWREFSRAQRRERSGRAGAEFWPWVLEGADPDRARQVTSRLPTSTRTLLTRVWVPRAAEDPRW